MVWGQRRGVTMKICHASSLIPDTVIIANIINLLQLLAARHKTNNTTQHDRNEYRSKKEPYAFWTHCGFGFQLNDIFFSKYDVIYLSIWKSTLCAHKCFLVYWNALQECSRMQFVRGTKIQYMNFDVYLNQIILFSVCVLKYKVGKKL